MLCAHHDATFCPECMWWYRYDPVNWSCRCTLYCDVLALSIVMYLHSLLWCTCTLYCDVLALSIVMYLHSLLWCTCTLYCDVLALSIVMYLHSLLWCTYTLYGGAPLRNSAHAPLACSAPLAYPSDVLWKTMSKHECQQINNHVHKGTYIQINGSNAP